MIRKSMTAAALLASIHATQAEIFEFYLGIDGAAQGIYGLPAETANPNYNRLTLLYAHPNAENPMSNHYHGIGAWSYTDETYTETQDTNANNRIPETYSGQAPLPMALAESGAYAGKLVQQPGAAEHYSHLAAGSTQDLTQYFAEPGEEPTPEQWMFNSSSGRYTGSLDGAEIYIELVSISPGLSVGLGDNPGALSTPGDRAHLGSGDLSVFAPVLWAEPDAEPGTYSASFRLLDLREDPGSAFGQSGVFHYDVAVPEPTTATAIVLAGMVMLRRRR